MDMRRVLVASVIAIIMATSAHAQFAGYVGIQTTTPAKVFTNATSGGTVTLFGAGGISQNIGQTAHYLGFCINGAFTGTINMQGSNDGGVTFTTLAVADYLNANVQQCHTLRGGGYWGLMQSTAVVSAGTLLSATYTGVASPIDAIPTGIATIGPMPPVVCDRGQSVVASAGTTLLLSPALTLDVVHICGMTLSFSAATTGGSVSIGWSTVSGCSSPVSTWIMFTPSTAPQTIVVSHPLDSPTWAGQNQFACVANSSGANVAVNLSYASVHVP